MARTKIIPFEVLSEATENQACKTRVVKTLASICRELERVMVAESEKKACREVEAWLRRCLIGSTSNSGERPAGG